MKIEQKFTVNAGPQRVWTFLTDPHQVVGCLPGATLTEKIDDRTYTGTITARIGPVTASYKGNVRFERLDPEVYEAEIIGRGQDVKGKGSVEMRMVSCLSPLEGGGTEVTVRSEISLIGLLAKFGRGIFQDVSDHIFQQFTASMKTKLEAETPGRPPVPAKAGSMDVLSLGAKALGRALGRTIRRMSGFSGS